MTGKLIATDSENLGTVRLQNENPRIIINTITKAINQLARIITSINNIEFCALIDSGASRSLLSEEV